MENQTIEKKARKKKKPEEEPSKRLPGE